MEDNYNIVTASALYQHESVIGMCPLLPESPSHPPPHPTPPGCLWIFKARILERVAVSSSREIFLTQGSNRSLLHCKWILYHWATWEALDICVGLRSNEVHEAAATWVQLPVSLGLDEGLCRAVLWRWGFLLHHQVLRPCANLSIGLLSFIYIYIFFFFFVHKMWHAGS